MTDENKTAQENYIDKSKDYKLFCSNKISYLEDQISQINDNLGKI